MEEYFCVSFSELAYLLSRDCPDKRFALCFGAGAVVFFISSFLGDIFFDLAGKTVEYFKKRRRSKS